MKSRPVAMPKYAPCTMQREAAIIDRLTNGRKGHQVFKAVLDDAPFEFLYPALPVVGRWPDPLCYGPDLRYPLADEVALR